MSWSEIPGVFTEDFNNDGVVVNTISRMFSPLLIVNLAQVKTLSYVDQHLLCLLVRTVRIHRIRVPVYIWAVEITTKNDVLIVSSRD